MNKQPQTPIRIGMLPLLPRPTTLEDVLILLRDSGVSEWDYPRFAGAEASHPSLARGDARPAFGPLRASVRAQDFAALAEPARSPFDEGTRLANL
jgi:hypothetical protein